MPYAGISFSRLYRLFAFSLAALVMTVGLAPRAHAQFQFTWTPGFEFANGAGSVLFSTLTVTATATGDTDPIGGDEYAITSIMGTFNGDPISLLGPGTDVGGRTVNNQFTADGTVTGLVLLSRRDANNILAEGFGFSAGGNNYLLCDGDCAFPAEQTSFDLFVWNSSGTAINSGLSGQFGEVITAVPGPLAGAGMLSWLAVMLMGLVWRRHLGRQASERSFACKASTAS